MAKNILKTVSKKIQGILEKNKKNNDHHIQSKNKQRTEKQAVRQKEKVVNEKPAREAEQSDRTKLSGKSAKKWTDFDYDAMDGDEFEYFCAKLLQANGFTDVELTKKTGDLGVDILAKKEQITYAVQCKCHTANIGNQAVRDVYSGKQCYHCMVGAVMTNRFFTKAAMELAAEHNILLWDRKKIQQFIYNAKRQIYAVGEEITAGEYWIFGEEDGRWKCVIAKDREASSILFQIVSEGRYDVEVKDGEYLILEEAKFCPVTSRKSMWYNSGWFAVKVGRELEAGMYRLSAADEEVGGYYAVYRSARYMDTEKIQSDFFEDQIFVELTEGTYLLGENCYLQKM